MLTCLKQTAAPRFHPLLPRAVQEAQGETAPRLQPILFSSLPRVLLSGLTCMLVDIPAYKTGPSTHLPHSTIPSGPGVHLPVSDLLWQRVIRGRGLQLLEASSGARTGDSDLLGIWSLV